jgi:hypothetical protein
LQDARSHIRGDEREGVFPRWRWALHASATRNLTHEALQIYTILQNTNLIVLLLLERDIFSLIWLIYAKRVENTT